MIVGIPKETAPHERRVALVPELIPKLTQASLEVLVQPGAGVAAGFPDSIYLEKGARLEPDLIPKLDILLKVQPPTLEEIGKLKPGSTFIGCLQPYTQFAEIEALAAGRITAFSLELVPRIARAQPMDALTSQAATSTTPSTRHPS